MTPHDAAACTTASHAAATATGATGGAVLLSDLVAGGRHPAASFTLALCLGDANITARDDNESKAIENPASGDGGPWPLFPARLSLPVFLSVSDPQSLFCCTSQVIAWTHAAAHSASSAAQTIDRRIAVGRRVSQSEWQRTTTKKKIIEGASRKQKKGQTPRKSISIIIHGNTDQHSLFLAQTFHLHLKDG